MKSADLMGTRCPLQSGPDASVQEVLPNSVECPYRGVSGRSARAASCCWASYSEGESHAPREAGTGRIAVVASRVPRQEALAAEFVRSNSAGHGCHDP